MDMILNIIVSVLLVVIIVLFIVFSRRIAVFNASKKELAIFLEGFQQSILRAERNINELKAMGDQVDENLKSQIKKARFLANDLSFLTEKGENVANSLDNRISMSRDLTKKVPNTNNPRGDKSTPITQAISAVDSAVRNKNMANSGDNIASGKAKNQMSPTKKQALDSLLRQIAKKKSELS